MEVKSEQDRPINPYLCCYILNDVINLVGLVPAKADRKCDCSWELLNASLSHYPVSLSCQRVFVGVVRVFMKPVFPHVNDLYMICKSLCGCKNEFNLIGF